MLGALFMSLGNSQGYSDNSQKPLYVNITIHHFYMPAGPKIYVAISPNNTSIPSYKSKHRCLQNLAMILAGSNEKETIWSSKSEEHLHTTRSTSSSLIMRLQ